MSDEQKRTWLEIHLDNLTHNVKEIRARLPENCRYMGVVKANAYGHGALQVAGSLVEAGCDYLAVACLDEAMTLRQGGIDAPILILGYTAPEYAGLLAENHISQTISSLDMAAAFSERLHGQSLTCHLKLETGMGRTGFRTESPEEMEQASTALSLPGLDFEGVFTHFAVSDEPAETAFTEMQYQRFTGAYAALERLWGRRFAIHHCANTGAVINYPQYALDMVRPGLATYGLYPAAETGALELRPVMEMKTRVTQITSHEAGDTISYGRKFRAEKPMRIAVLSIGYADGLFRGLSGKMEVLIRGHRVRQIGRICMDMCMADVTDFPDIRTGDVVTIFGRDGEESISADALAETLDTISYEILCAVSPRVPHVYVK